MTRWQIVCGAAVMSCVLGSGLCEAANDQELAMSDPSTEDFALDAPMPSSTSSPSPVIGYEPIPNSALPELAAGRQPVSIARAPSTAQPAPVAMPAETVSRAYPSGPTPGAQGLYTDGRPGVVAPTHQLPGAPSNVGTDYAAWLVGTGPYTLGRDDILRIQVRNQPEFSGDFIVGPEGAIQYNFLGDVPVLGMTKGEVEQVLAQKLSDYVRVPEVNVQIIAYNSKAVYVIGEVNRPGKYIMRGDTIKLREALMAAGLPTRHAAISRAHIITPDEDKPIVRSVSVRRLLYRGELDSDVTLQPGEIVVLPTRVLSAINRFLSDLFNPVARTATNAAVGAAL